MDSTVLSSLECSQRTSFPVRMWSMVRVCATCVRGQPGNPPLSTSRLLKTRGAGTILVTCLLSLQFLMATSWCRIAVCFCACIVAASASLGDPNADPTLVLYLQRLFDSVKGRQPQGGELNLLPDESSGFANTVHCFPARRGKWEITGFAYNQYYSVRYGGARVCLCLHDGEQKPCSRFTVLSSNKLPDPTNYAGMSRSQ